MERGAKARRELVEGLVRHGEPDPELAGLVDDRLDGVVEILLGLNGPLAGCVLRFDPSVTFLIPEHPDKSGRGHHHPKQDKPRADRPRDNIPCQQDAGEKRTRCEEHQCAAEHQGPALAR